MTRLWLLDLMVLNVAFAQFGFFRYDSSHGISIGTCPRVRPDLSAKRLRQELTDAPIPKPKNEARDYLNEFLGLDLRQCAIPGVIGQHFALDIVPPAMSAHFSDPDPGRPLVLFFAGPNGVGKTVRYKS